jgi:PKD repeat protein
VGSAFRYIFILFGILLVSKGLALPVFTSIAFNNDTVGKFDKLEITVYLTANYVNPFDFNQVNLKGQFTSPSGQVYVVDGFYYQNFQMNPPEGDLIPVGSPHWKIRFSPKETGTWSVMLSCKDGTGTAWSGSYQVVCIPSSNPGFISNSTTYFQKFSNGQSFFPVGLSIPWNLYEGGFYIYDEWLDSLIANQANFFKIIMAPWSFGIEWNDTYLGNYSNRLDIAFWVDWLMNRAEVDGLYMQLCPLIHNEVSTLGNNDWAWSPYNSVNGGPCQNTWDFYTNTTARYYYKQKLRYIQARWGYSTSLAAWELFTETDNTGDFEDHQDQINTWLLSTGQYLDSLDIYDHPISPSYAWFGNDPEIWENDLVDFTQIHIYNSSNDLELLLHSGTKHYLAEYGKPNIIGEFALGHDPATIISQDPDGIAFHNSLWATAFSGSYGPATSWHWDSYIHAQGLYYHFAPVSAFMQTVDLLGKSYQPVSVFCTSSQNLNTEISPGYKVLFSPAPSNYFTIETTGNMVPRSSNLSYMLYGSLFNSSRNPPHFLVNYTKPGQFKVETGSNCLLSHLKIWIDNVKVLDETAHANSTYIVDVAQGEHELFIDNTGTFYVEIDKFVFMNYAPVCRSFALKASNQVTGWVQNRQYNWQYVGENGPPPPLSQGVMNFTGLTDSYYSLQWYGCSDALLDSLKMVTTSGGNLSVTVPGIVWDAAYKINYLSSAIVADFTQTGTEVCKNDTVTFTDLSTGIITGRIWQFPGGTPQTSTLANPQVIYSAIGDYNVILKVYNAFDTVVIVDTALIHVNDIPAQAGPMAGDSQVCQGEVNLVYFITPVANADSYIWTLPPGASGSSTTNLIHVTYNVNATSGNLLVRAVNECGPGGSSQKYINVTPLVGPAGPITGETTVCQGSTHSYQVEPVANATSYEWTVPTGMSGSSTTNQIGITFDSAMVCGLIQVNGVNGCGTGTGAVIPVCVDPLPAITQQPVTAVVEFYNDALFEVPMRTSLNYQWQTISAGQEGWQNLQDTGVFYGTQTNSLNILAPGPAMNETDYRCIVSGICPPPVTSQQVMLYVVPEGWEMTITSAYHRLHIPLLANPSINGEPINTGDYIGVFFEDNGQLICAGTRQWNGNQSLTIKAYGDDPATAEKDGFDPGDVFYWKIYSFEEGTEVDAEATILLGPSVFTPGMQSSLSSLNGTLYTDHTITLPAGWSGISSYLIPVNDSVESIFAPIQDDLVILLDLTKIYWPAQDVNTLVNWNPYQGYYIKTETATQFTITGIWKAEPEAGLTAGWNIMPVLSETDVSTIQTTIFSALGSNLIVAREVIGNKVYWPGMNVYSLTILEPGKSYQILVTSPCTLYFP